MNGKVLGVRKVYGNGSSPDGEFEVSFVDHMWNTHGRSEVSSGAAFKSYSASKNHVAIARTSWAGFSAFLEHLQAVGKCRLRKETDAQRGYLISMVELGCSPSSGKRKAEDDKEERVLDEQIQRAAKALRKHLHAKSSVKPGELQRTEKVSFALPRAAPAAAVEKPLPSPPPLFQLAAAAPPPPSPPPPPTEILSKSKMETITQQLEAEKLKDLFSCPRGPKWVDAGLIVRLTRHPPRYLERFAKKQAVVEDVNKDGVKARIRFLHDRQGQRLTVDQDLLRTVVPAVGELVRVVNGGFKGWDGKIVSKDSHSKTVERSGRDCHPLEITASQVSVDFFRGQSLGCGC